MGFLAPWFLAGLAAVGLPVWLHLLKRHKTTPLPFSSLMFFERRTQSSIKHRRLRYLLLFAARTALVALLALVFADPFLRRESAPAAHGRKLLVLAVDNSFSMRHGDRLERAKRQAAAALSGLRSGDRAQVLAFNSGVRMMSDATEDPAALRAAVEAVEPGDARGSYAELARALRVMAQTARIPVEAHVFSDMQKSSLPSSFADLRLAEGIQLVTHPLADRRESNFAVENVSAPRRVYGAGRARVQVTVAGYGTSAGSRRVSLWVNGREVEAKNAAVGANGRVAVEFLGLDAAHGLNRVEVRMDAADALPADDRFYFSVERADPRPALLVHDGGRAPLYFRAALEAAAESAFQLDTVTVDHTANVAPNKYAFVVISDVASLPPAFESTVKDYVRAGGSLLVALGPRARARVPVFEERVIEARYFSREGARFQTAAWLDPAHPSIRAANRWDDVKFYHAVRVEPGKARVAARLSDETPLLLEKQVGEGRVLVFASSFDNVANDFPLHAAFVPFIDQTAQYLARLDDRPAHLAVDSYLELRGARDRGAAIEVLGPDGGRALSLDEATKAQNLRVSASGFYEVRRPSGRHELVAVNADRAESDLEVIPAETLELWRNTGQAGSAAAGGGDAEGKPWQLWWYVMFAVLAVGLAESWLGNRHLAEDKEAA